MSSKTQPTKNRITGIDALRGFALFGILIVNIFVFNAPYGHYGTFYLAFDEVQVGVVLHMFFFFAGRFMFIFAFLFGYGCCMQYEKYTDHYAFRKFWWRRMFWLAIFGVVHILLFSYGDILLPYALLGMTLPFVLRLRNRTLIVLFLIVYLIPVYEFVLRQHFNFPSIFTEPVYELEKEISIGAEGSFWELFQLRLKQYLALQSEKVIMYIPKEWSLFIIGVIASRYKLATELSKRKAVVFCIIASVIVFCNYLYNEELPKLFDYENSLVQSIIYGLIVKALNFIHGMLYIIGFWLLWRFSFFQRLFSSLKSAGRMSLTIYIMQSMICAVLFSGYGFGMYGSQTPVQLLWLACGIFAGQLIFAELWLEWFRFGPLEWLWRRLSY
ncbi:MAG: DUF418 domain-containing protein [Saprospiraceae bacterium]